MSNLFVKFAGIEGSATAQGYQGWSTLHSVHVNIGREVNTQPGKANNRIQGHPVFSGLTITKPTDSSTNQLLQLICTGKLIPQTEIHVCTTSAGFEPYEKYMLENVFIASLAKAVAQRSEPMEIIKLDFSSIRHTYLGRTESHVSASSSTAGYDLTQAKAL